MAEAVAIGSDGRLLAVGDNAADEALLGTFLENVPVKLYASDLHCAWYNNSAAIELPQGQSFDIGVRITN